MPDFGEAKVRIAGARVIGATERAIKVDVPGLGEPLWIPQSQIDDDSECWTMGDEGDLVISEWIAEQKGLT